MENQKDWFKQISRDKDNIMFGVELWKEWEDTLSCSTVIPHYPINFWKLIGVCGLCYIDWVSGTAEISFYIDSEYQDTEVEFDAFALLIDKARLEFNLNRLWAENYAFYTHGIQVLKEAGFVLEGTMRKHVYKQGQYHDSLLYGKLL